MMNDKQFIRPLPQIILYLGLLTVLVSCAPAATAMPPTETPQPENTATAAVTPTATEVPTITPIPITYVQLTQPFDPNCKPYTLADSTFNGLKSTITSQSGHVDIWAKDCKNPTEVYAPITGIIELGDVPNVVNIFFPTNTYPIGFNQALNAMGLNTYSGGFNELDVNLGHIQLDAGIQPGQTVHAGQHLGTLVESHWPSPKLAIQINWMDPTRQYYFLSPTLLVFNTMFSPNYNIPPDDPAFYLMSNGKVPFLCDTTTVRQITGGSCYPGDKPTP